MSLPIGLKGSLRVKSFRITTIGKPMSKFKTWLPKMWWSIMILKIAYPLQPRLPMSQSTTLSAK